MRVFRFEFESVLRWRQQKLELEQASLKLLFADLHRLEAERTAAQDRWDAEEEAVRSHGAITGRLLSNLAEYQQCVELQLRALDQRERELRTRIQEQQAAVMEAERAVRVLEKLKEQRQEEWTRELDHEIEQLAAESYLSRWNTSDHLR